MSDFISTKSPIANAPGDPFTLFAALVDQNLQFHTLSGDGNYVHTYVFINYDKYIAAHQRHFIDRSSMILFRSEIPMLTELGSSLSEYKPTRLILPVHGVTRKLPPKEKKRKKKERKGQG
jgi:hypothetical protein